jgi:hypothetical protein
MFEAEVVLGGSFSRSWHDGLGSCAFELRRNRRCRHLAIDAKYHF